MVLVPSPVVNPADVPIAMVAGRYGESSRVTLVALLILPLVPTVKVKAKSSPSPALSAENFWMLQRRTITGIGVVGMAFIIGARIALPPIMG